MTTHVATVPVAVVLGASSGLGLAIARTLWQNGYEVIAAARNLERLQAVKSQICGAETSNSTDDAPLFQAPSMAVQRDFSRFGPASSL